MNDLNESWLSRQAKKPYAEIILYTISFAESSFFPLPPDPILISMCVINKARIVRYAVFCTLISVLGGLLGYFIGYTLFELVGKKILRLYSYEEHFSNIVSEFQTWAFWLIAIKGLTPIPFKIITIASGVAKVNLTTFVTASLIARGFRFSLVAIICYFFDKKVKFIIDRYQKTVIWGTLLIIIFGFILAHIFFC